MGETHLFFSIASSMLKKKKGCLELLHTVIICHKEYSKPSDFLVPELVYACGIGLCVWIQSEADIRCPPH